MSEKQELRLEEQDLRLLKTILNQPAIASEFANIYDDSIFLGDAKKFAKMVISYIKAYKAPPTKRVMLDRCSNNVELLDEISNIWDCVQEVECDASEFKYDLDKIKNRFVAKKVVSLKNSLSESSGDITSTLKGVQEQLDDIKRVQKGKRQTYTQKTLKSFIPDFKQTYNDKYHNKEIGRGIMTSYSHLDYIKGGMLPSEMMIICGESGAGKSLLLNNIAIQMFLQKNTVFSTIFTKGYNVLYFSLEMPYESCVRRSLARFADVPNYGLRDASLNKSQVEAMKLTTDFIERYPYEFEIVDIPRGATVSQIEARFLEAQSRFNPDIVVVDYLGLLESPEASGDDWLRLGAIAGQLAEFARVYNVVLLTATQLNRSQGSKSKQTKEDLVGLHRIGRSALIAHHADICLQIMTRADENTFSDFKYSIIKHRNGALGDGILLKNFKNSSIIDSPFEPENEENQVVNELQDISELLAKYNWGK